MKCKPNDKNTKMEEQMEPIPEKTENRAPPREDWTQSSPEIFQWIGNRRSLVSVEVEASSNITVSTLGWVEQPLSCHRSLSTNLHYLLERLQAPGVTSFLEMCSSISNMHANSC